MGTGGRRESSGGKLVMAYAPGAKGPPTYSGALLVPFH